MVKVWSVVGAMVMTAIASPVVAQYVPFTAEQITDSAIRNGNLHCQAVYAGARTKEDVVVYTTLNRSRIDEMISEYLHKTPGAKGIYDEWIKITLTVMTPCKDEFFRLVEQ